MANYGVLFEKHKAQKNQYAISERLKKLKTKLCPSSTKPYSQKHKLVTWEHRFIVFFLTPTQLDVYFITASGGLSSQAQATIIYHP